MSVELSGNSPAALTAGILLLSRARQFGQRLSVSVMGDPDQITPVEGPALVHSAVLASCGVGSRPGGGAVVVVPGPSEASLAVCLDDFGAGVVLVDRSGQRHPATRALVRLCRVRTRRAVAWGGGARGVGARMHGGAIGARPHAASTDFAVHRIVLGMHAGQSLRTRARVPLHHFLGPATATELHLQTSSPWRPPAKL